MKKILLLFLCAISYNTAWTSGAATSEEAVNSQPLANMAVTKSICVLIHRSKGNPTLLTASDDTNKSITQFRYSNDHYYREAHYAIDEATGKIGEAADFQACIEPNQEFVQAIDQAYIAAKKRSLYRNEIKSLWLVNQSVQLAEAKGSGVKIDDDSVKKEIVKKFPNNRNGKKISNG